MNDAELIVVGILVVWVATLIALVVTSLRATRQRNVYRSRVR